MKLEVLFYTVLMLTILSGVGACAIALTSSQPDPARMAVALRLAKLTFICGAALAGLLGSALIP